LPHQVLYKSAFWPFFGDRFLLSASRKKSPGSVRTGCAEVGGLLGDASMIFLIFFGFEIAENSDAVGYEFAIINKVGAGDCMYNRSTALNSFAIPRNWIASLF
jgi:hypothetical protein